MVATIVAVLKFLLPIAYSRMFFIPRPDARPKIKFNNKNAIITAISKSNFIIFIYGNLN
jgi:hypothetical protein